MKRSNVAALPRQGSWPAPEAPGAPQNAMNLLCIDTTSPALVLALVRPGQPLVGRVCDTGGQHAEVLLPELGELLAEAQLDRANLDAVGVTLGPGGFTSVRVGLATAKGLCLGRGRALYGVSSLRALAFGVLSSASPAGAIGVVTRAYRGEVYAALYAPGAGGLLELLAPFHATPAAAALRLTAAAADAGVGPVGLLGDGAALYPEAFTVPQQFIALAPELQVLTPAALAAALLDEVVAERARDLATLEPEYLKPPDAALPKAR